MMALLLDLAWFEIVIGVVAWLGFALVLAIGLGSFCYRCDEDARKK